MMWEQVNVLLEPCALYIALSFHKTFNFSSEIAEFGRSFLCSFVFFRTFAFYFHSVRLHGRPTGAHGTPKYLVEILSVNTHPYIRILRLHQVGIRSHFGGAGKSSIEQGCKRRS